MMHQTSYMKLVCQLRVIPCPLIVAYYITCISSHVLLLKTLQTNEQAFISIPSACLTERPLLCELHEAALKLITRLEFERLSPNKAVPLRK